MDEVISFQVDWNPRHNCWVAWCHQKGEFEFGATDPTEALAGLLRELSKEKK